MLELLTKYSIGEIILFIVVAAVAFKKVADFIDWLHEKITKRDKKKIEQQQHEEDAKIREEEMKARVEAMETQMKEVVGVLNDISKKVNILTESDKDAIKAWITREHHYYCYQKGWIDDYSLDCLERRYTHYKEENGNSFISELMNEIRGLPMTPPQDTEEEKTDDT